MAKENIWLRPIEEILSSSFGKYAKYIIQDRALPDVRDGMKPVQRRILYAMYDLGITHDKAYKKSARSVGEVIGKYHPHGDSSIYEAMVRMSQEWKNNIPMIDMHGNKGSIDGDGPAAMRYTECRLSKIAEYMLENIHKKTVEFIPNFDDSEKEPSYLPSLIPSLLINGATGIAAGYATNIPPFNPVEVFDAIIHKLDNPNCSVDTLLKIMPGPDFPTAGIINGVSGIKEAYETGRGKFTIKAEFEELDHSKKIKQLIIKSIPYETNKSNIIKSIDDLVYNEKINGIIEVRDESDMQGISIVLDIEADKSLETIKNFLYKNTSLQVTYAINFIAIHNRKPVLLPMHETLNAYINHAIDILVKTLNFDLTKAMKRLEVLKGLIKAISILDDVIHLIRKSTSKDDAKKNLISRFQFTEVQAEAIVSLRLYRLSSTDVLSIKKEAEELTISINEINTILNSEELQKNALKKILRGYKTEFNVPRKSTITGEIEKIIINESELQESKDVVVMITRDGYLKTTTTRSIESSKYGDFILKSGDMLLDIFESNTLNQVVVITSNGQYISIPCHKIKSTKYKDAAEHINNLIALDSDVKIISAFQTSGLLASNGVLLICTEHGKIKRIELENLTFSKNPKSSSIINLNDGDKVVAAQVIDKNTTGEVVCITKNGMALRFMADEIPVIGRSGAGVIAQKLVPGDNIVSCLFSNNPLKHQILITANRGFKRIHFKDINLTKRANIGRMVMLQVKSDPFILKNAYVINSRDTINILKEDNQIETLVVSDIPLTDLETRFVDLKKGNVVISHRDNWISNSIDSITHTKSLNSDDESKNDSEEENNDTKPTVQGSLF
ncbi:MAG: DNA topoisomerase IV subunit A [Mycoplasma sp.]